MRKMKKIIAGLISSLIILCVLSSCGKSSQTPLRILLDLGSTPTGLAEEAAESLRNTIIARGGPSDIEIEVLPSTVSVNGDLSYEAERNAQMTRIRTEIMAGSGPDVIIADCTNKNGLSLFKMPDKTKELGLFAPLDEYIVNAQFMEWDSLTSVIMDAGKSEEYGQVLIPLTYTFPVTFFRKSDFAIENNDNLTWSDIINGDDQLLKMSMTPNLLASTWSFGPASLGVLADYSQGRSTLLFSEEELLNRVKQVMELKAEIDAVDASTYPDCYKTSMMVDFEQSNFSIEQSLSGDNDAPYDYIPELVDNRGEFTSEPLSMIPVYNDAGGITATICSFAAINANTKRVNDAFFVLDVLLDRDIQQSSNIWYRLLVGTLPVYDELMTDQYPISSFNSWQMSTENYTEFTQIRSQISQVKFNGSIEQELEDLFFRCLVGDYSDEDIEEDVHYTYMRIRQMASE